MTNKKICKFFMNGNCKKGVDCDFTHDDNLCKHYFNGNCKFGDKCKLSHLIKSDDNNKNNNKNKHRKKNTQSFKPDLTEPDMRVIIKTDKINDLSKFNIQMKENDVVILDSYFKNNTTIYDQLVQEMESCGVPPDELWKLWHGDTHFIADDRLAKKMGFDWKEKCPTFNMVIESMKEYFDMDVKATRFNLYKDNTEWKPYHHDAAAIDDKKAKTQNFTVGVTFGATRTASFQHAKTKTRIDFPLTDGSVYTFAKQVNVDWMHGIIQEPEIKKEGRISIILWGKNNQIV